MDTNPLAANPEVVLKEHWQDFIDGLTVLSRLFPNKPFSRLKRTLKSINYHLNVKKQNKSSACLK